MLFLVVLSFCSNIAISAHLGYYDCSEGDGEELWEIVDNTGASNYAHHQSVMITRSVIEQCIYDCSRSSSCLTIHALTNGSTIHCALVDVYFGKLSLIPDVPGQTVIIAPRCPAGFTMGTYIRCYKVITHPESWNDAALECGNLDPPAHLAIPDTSEKANELSTSMLDLGFPLSLNNPSWAGKFAHIGARDTNNDCVLRFQYGSNEVVPDNLWDSGEGDWNCINRNEHCVAIRFNGKLHAHNCDYAYPYICEL